MQEGEKQKFANEVEREKVRILNREKKGNFCE